MNIPNGELRQQSALDYVVLNKGASLAPNYISYDYGDIVIGLTHYPSPTSTGKWHQHEMSMISGVLIGGNIETRKDKSFERRAGSTSFYRAYESHANQYEQFPARHISLEISNRFIETNGFCEQDLEHAIRYIYKPQISLVSLLKEAMFDDPNTKDTLNMLALDFISKPARLSHNLVVPDWVNVTKELLNDRWNETVSLEEISKATGVHPCTLSKYFSHYFYCSFGNYTRKLKTQRALAMLHDTKYSISDVAVNCGFADHSHFTRTFKSLTGFLPKSFRTI